MIPFVDTHFHLWDRDELSYPWLEHAWHPVLGPVDAIAESHIVDDYLAAISGLGVAAAVHVQADAADPLRETEWLTAVGDATGWPQAIVAFVDLTAAGYEEALARQASFTRVRGIRDLRVAKTGERRDWSGVADALARLADHGLHYELRVTHAEAAAAVELLTRLEGVPVVLTHAGLPLGRTPDELRAWTEAIELLASVDYLHCKLSGFGMGRHLAGEPWSTDAIRPLVETCLERFGTARAFFGSNWPVETLAVDYPAMLATYRDLVAGLSAAEQRALLAENALRFYRFDTQETVPVPFRT